MCFVFLSPQPQVEEVGQGIEGVGEVAEVVVGPAVPLGVVGAACVEEKVFVVRPQGETLSFQVDNPGSGDVIDAVAQLSDLVAQVGFFEVHEEVLVEAADAVEEGLGNHQGRAHHVRHLFRGRPGVEVFVEAGHGARPRVDELLEDARLAYLVGMSRGLVGLVEVGPADAGFRVSFHEVEQLFHGVVHQQGVGVQAEQVLSAGMRGPQVVGPSEAQVLGRRQEGDAAVVGQQGGPDRRGVVDHEHLEREAFGLGVQTVQAVENQFFGVVVYDDDGYVHRVGSSRFLNGLQLFVGNQPAPVLGREREQERQAFQQVPVPVFAQRKAQVFVGLVAEEQEGHLEGLQAAGPQVDVEQAFGHEPVDAFLVGRVILDVGFLFHLLQDAEQPLAVAVELAPAHDEHVAGTELVGVVHDVVEGLAESRVAVALDEAFEGAQVVAHVGHAVVVEEGQLQRHGLGHDDTALFQPGKDVGRDADVLALAFARGEEGAGKAFPALAVEVEVAPVVAEPDVVDALQVLPGPVQGRELAVARVLGADVVAAVVALDVQVARSQCLAHLDGKVVLVFQVDVVFMDARQDFDCRHLLQV